MKFLFLLLYSVVIRMITTITKSILNQIKRIIILFEKYIEIPVIKFIAEFFSKKLEKKLEKNIVNSQWKIRAFDDFKSWLANVDSNEIDPSKLSVTPDTCDLYTLFSEFTALKQEIKMQTREQHRALGTLQSFTDNYHETSELFKTRTEDIAELEHRIRLNCEKKSVVHFLDVRDALIRGHRASLEIIHREKCFIPWHKDKDLKNVSKGYEMAIRRFDKALGLMDIQPVKTVNEKFDPNRMRAVETKSAPGYEKGMVVEELSGGFIRNDEILRFAEVIVSR